MLSLIDLDCVISIALEVLLLVACFDSDQLNAEYELRTI